MAAIHALFAQYLKDAKVAAMQQNNILRKYT